MAFLAARKVCTRDLKVGVSGSVVGRVAGFRQWGGGGNHVLWGLLLNNA